MTTPLNVNASKKTRRKKKRLTPLNVNASRENTSPLLLTLCRSGGDRSDPAIILFLMIWNIAVEWLWSYLPPKVLIVWLSVFSQPGMVHSINNDKIIDIKIDRLEHSFKPFQTFWALWRGVMAMGIPGHWCEIMIDLKYYKITLNLRDGTMCLLDVGARRGEASIVGTTEHHRHDQP